MSSFARTIQRRAKRGFTSGPGARLGIHNDEAKDLLARLARDERKQS